MEGKYEYIKKCLTNIRTELDGLEKSLKIEEHLKFYDKITIPFSADVEMDKSKLTDFINNIAKKAIVLITAQSFVGEAIGTGFNIREDGKILTAAHVVSGADKIEICFTDNPSLKEKLYEACVIFKDVDADIALLQILGFDRGEVLSLALPSYEAPTGTDVGLFGYPAVIDLGFTVTYTKGVVSKHSVLPGSSVMTYQIDAGAYRGNSGGPLINLKTGKVIGILTGGDDVVQFANFAVDVKEVCNRIIEEYKISPLIPPLMRFTDNGDGTITDNITGLIWAKEASTPTVGSCTGGKMTWGDAHKYIECLNNVKYLNHSDWKLPSKDQLMSLINGAGDIPFSWLNAQGFSGVQQSWYWSSTTGASHTDSAWYVDMVSGFVDYGSKGYYGYYAWPVRLGQ